MPLLLKSKGKERREYKDWIFQRQNYEVNGTEPSVWRREEIHNDFNQEETLEIHRKDQPQGGKTNKRRKRKEHFCLIDNYVKVTGIKDSNRLAGSKYRGHGRPFPLPLLQIKRA